MNRAFRELYLAAVIAVGLTLLGVYGLAFVLYANIGVYFFLVRRIGLKYSSISLLVYFLLLSAFFSVSFSFVTVVSYAGFGILVGYIYYRERDPFTIIMMLSLFEYAKNILSVGLLKSVGAQVNFQEMTNMMIENQSAFIESIGASSEEITELIRQLFVSSQFFLALFSGIILYVVFGVFVRFAKDAPPFLPLSYFRIPKFSMPALIALIFVCYFVSKTFMPADAFLLTAGVILVLVFALNGFATIVYLIASRQKNKVFAYIIGILCLAFFPLNAMLALLGLMDAQFNIRKLVIIEK